MRKIIASTLTTLDGFIDDPHLWSMSHSSDAMQKYSFDLVFAADALLLGRVTFEGMAQAWPAMGGNPYADRINDMAKYAVSSTKKSADEWHNSRVIHPGNLAEEVAELKRQPGQDILVWGTGQLTDALVEHGLLDEYRLWIYPVVKGGGQRLFREGAEQSLALEDSVTFDTGVVVLTYRPV